MKSVAYLGIISAMCATGGADQEVRDLAETYIGQTGASGSTAALDRFGPQTQFDWAQRSHNGYVFFSEWNSAGRSVMQKAFINGARETAVGFPGIEQWNDVAANLFTGTVGNTREEDLDPLSSVPTASQISWWKEMRDDGDVRYGFRPFDEKPYVYGSIVWRDRQGKVICIADSRFRYVPPAGAHIEEKMILPLTKSWQVAAGASFDPERIGSNGSDSRASMSLSRILTDARSASIGCSVNERWRIAVTASLSLRF